MISCLACAALRSARNAKAVVARIRDEALIEVDVISEADEARLVRAGVLHGLKAVVKADIAHTAYPDFHYATQAVPGGFYLVSTLLLEAALGRAPESP